MRRGRRRLVAVVGTMVMLSSPTVGERALAVDDTFDHRMLELINGARAANGLPPVVANPVLTATADGGLYQGCGFPVAGRADDMGARSYFSHTIRDCGNQSVFHMLAATGLSYSGAGENIAWVNAVTDPVIAAENLHSQLMGSEPHRANILNRNFTSVGIGSWRTAPGQTCRVRDLPCPTSTS